LTIVARSKLQKSRICKTSRKNVAEKMLQEKSFRSIDRDRATFQRRIVENFSR